MPYITIETANPPYRMFNRDTAADTQEFYRLIDEREWYEAAELLGQYTETNEDSQDWLSGGDWPTDDRPSIEQVAAEFDAYVSATDA